MRTENAKLILSFILPQTTHTLWERVHLHVLTRDKNVVTSTRGTQLLTMGI